MLANELTKWINADQKLKMTRVSLNTRSRA